MIQIPLKALTKSRIKCSCKYTRAQKFEAPLSASFLTVNPLVKLFQVVELTQTFTVDVGIGTAFGRNKERCLYV